jgi:hypothetical protein
MSEDVWRRQISEAERSGDFLSVHDRAVQALQEHPGTAWFGHRAVLALARTGATATARGLFTQLGLAALKDEDSRALDARLLKDEALRADPSVRPARLRAAAEAYAAIYADTRGTYPAINAATLYRLSGDDDRSRAVAREVLESVAVSERGGPAIDYYAAATKAEAALLLNDAALAAAALRDASTLHGGDHAAVATTYRQLALVCRHADLPLTILDPIRPPPVIHFAGHIIMPPGKAGRFTADREQAVTENIREHLRSRRVGYGFGSLAAGADILFAEALLDDRAELHVILPFDEAEFRAISVAPAGESWLARYERCLRGAKSVTMSSTEPYAGDELLFAYCSQLAMGLAVLRARHLSAELEQVAVWDGRPTKTAGGTAADVTFWNTHGLPSTIISPSADATTGVPSTEAPPPLPGGTPARRLCAMLFGDVKGYSKLRESQVTAFVHGVMGTLAKALEPFDADILSRNTWGDAVYIVLRDAPAAAHAALALQRAMRGLDLAALGLPAAMGLRIGAHAGPVFEHLDPITRQPTQFGTHVTRTARIEPITPVGEVYVTEQFAAALSLETNAFHCEYVGHMESAKGFGPMRMYLLRPT